MMDERRLYIGQLLRNYKQNEETEICLIISAE